LEILIERYESVAELLIHSQTVQVHLSSPNRRELLTIHLCSTRGH
jgi:hypothetical protein